MSTEWIVEYLSRRQLSTADFLRHAETMSQNQISETFRIQKRDVGSILRALGFDTQASRGKKISAANERARNLRVQEKNELARELPEGIIAHVEAYGLKDARSAFGEDQVKLLIDSSVEFSVPHSSQIRSNLLKRDVDSRREQILELMEKKRSPSSIASELGLNAQHVRRLILSLNPSYSGNLRSTEELARTESKLQKSRYAAEIKRSSAVESMLRSHSRAICEERVLELLRLGRVPTDRILLDTYGVGTGIQRGQFQDLYAELAGINLKELKPVFTKLVAGWKRCPGYEPATELLQTEAYQAIERPGYLGEFTELYRAIIFSLDATAVQNLVDSAHVSNASDLVNGYFPFHHFQSYLETFIYPAGISFYEASPEELIEKRFGSQLETVHSDLSEAADTVQSLRELYSLYPTVLPYHIHRALDFFSIRLSRLALSEPESRVKEILDEMGVSYLSHDRKILPSKRELDFYVPSMSLGIEVNPTHTHNSTFGFQKRCEPRPASYHLNKSKEALEAGIRLIHVYDEDLARPELLSALLRQQLLGYERVLYGREVRILKVEGERARIARAFLSNYHRQGSATAKIYYQILSRDDELVGVASFSPAKTHGADWELKRLCFLPGVQIRYGISKLVARFAVDFPDARRLLSYSNIDYGYSDSYERAGFELIGETGPSLRWVSPSDPLDSYSWSVATPWGAKSGVIAKTLGSRNCSMEEAERLMVEEMPHRTDRSTGYVKLYRAGSKILVKDL